MAAFFSSSIAPGAASHSHSASPNNVSPTLPPPIPTTGESRSSPRSSTSDPTRLSPPLHDGQVSSATSTTTHSDIATPLFDRPPSSSASSSTRPQPPTRSASYKADDIWGSSAFNSSSRTTSSDFSFQRTTRAASDGLILTSSSFANGAFSPNGNSEGRAAGGTRLSSLGSDDSSEEQALFREHQRRSLEHSASQGLTSSKGFLASPPLTSATAGAASSLSANRGATSPFFQPPSFLSTAAPTPNGASHSPLPTVLSPTATSPPASSSLPQSANLGAQNGQQQFGAGEAGPPGSRGATLHLGDLDVWMDEAYVRECCTMMGWDSVINVKMSRGASPSSGYCFLTFPSAADAGRVLARFNSTPPILMPRSGRTFKLNWGTGLPGIQPRWDGEFSVFVGDLAREVGESELMGLFTPLFPSTKSAKVMCDPSTGLSRGYGFVRFTEESDMQRALNIGGNPNSGLQLHGRTIRISEASGPNAAGGPSAMDGMGHLRERTRTRSSEGAFSPHHQPSPQFHQPQGYFPPYPTHVPPPHMPDSPYDHSHLPHPYASPPLSGGPNGYHGGPFSPNGGSGTYAPAIQTPGGGGGLMSPPLSTPISARGPLSPGLAGPIGMGAGESLPQQQPRPQIRQQGSVPPGGDPNNTTVFVGGLPACISEETLKSFFHHFGDITYCKIPAGKGCGFVQFVRRQDAELAIAKMNDFPIHGKSRIRLSWGRSQGDKQVEHVRKLASALGVPFDAVWRMVQGQDNSTIKQIATAVNGGSSAAQQAGQQTSSSPPTQHSRMDLRAVANAAGLTESEVLDLVKGNPGTLANSPCSGGANGNSSHGSSTTGSNSDFFGRAANGMNGSLTSLETAAATPAAPPSSAERNGPNPYSRVSPSSFSALANTAGGQLPLSPPPSAGPVTSFAAHQAQYPPVQLLAPSPNPYTAIRPESYSLQHPASSPYERVDFAEGGRPGSMVVPGPTGAYQPQVFGVNNGRAGKWHNHGEGNYTTSPAPPIPAVGGGGLEDGFSSLSLQQHQHYYPSQQQQQPRTLPPPASRHAFQPTAPDFFPTALGSPTSTNAPPLHPSGPAMAAAQERGWGWGASGGVNA
ncbi:hypothetical protein JCM11641_007172 [Rhodosporidiobolus odoratus]